MAIITVSRKVGSWGDEMAAKVAKKLGYRLVSRQEVHQLAQSCDAEFKKACTLFESELPGSFLERFFYREPAFTSLFEALNCELAAEGNVVLLGRGAQIVLKDVPGVLKVRVVAPTEIRVERVMEREGLDRNHASDFVRRYDQQRRALIENIFGQDLADWSLYDLVVNTAHLDAEIGADMIAQAVGHLEGQSNWSQVQEDLKSCAMGKRVESAIKKQVFTAPYRDVKVEAGAGGAITLSGFVQDKRSRETAEELAKGYPGVTSVNNQLRTTELSF